MKKRPFLNHLFAALSRAALLSDPPVALARFVRSKSQLTESEREVSLIFIPSICFSPQHVVNKFQGTCFITGQEMFESLPQMSGHRSVILNIRARRCVWEAADDAAQCCYTPRAVFGNTEAACYYCGSQWEQLNRALFSPAKRRKRGG